MTIKIPLQPITRKVTSRLTQLDGLRGLAILMVFFYHSFSRWPEKFPYGDSYAEIPIFEYGWTGVQLFFLISGFVILMSLERCSSVTEFLKRRWLRLFPTMLVASILIVSTASLFPERPAGVPSLSGFLAGLTFIDPIWWSKILGFPITSLEGSFWTLFIEWRFYVIAAIVYFATGRRHITLIVFLCLCSFTAEGLDKLPWIQDFWVVNKLDSLAKYLSLRHFIWFSAGASFYMGWKKDSSVWFNIGLATSVVASALSANGDPESFLASLLVSLLFAASLRIEQIKRILSYNFLVYVGFISYPLYLIHENITVSAIVKLGQWSRVIPDFMLPLIPLLFLSAAAFVIAYTIEPLVRKRLDRLLMKT
jgi:peptidoglycan/LPS O-acetylase OafA/YrhL